VLRAYWAALDGVVDGEEAACLARGGVLSMLTLLRHHFHNEELFMSTLKYSDLQRHRADHQRLIRDFKNIANILPSKSKKWHQVFSLLREWYVEHGRDYDVQLHLYVNESLSQR
jgi:hemerythrin-like metal-binding protein